MKKALIGLAVVVLVVVAGAVWLLGSLDKIVKQQIEVVGSELTGVPVRVGGVSIDIKTGTGQITGLSIGNPDGYKASKAFDMKLLRLGIDLQSIGKQPLVLSELVIDSPVVNMEVNETGGSNLKEILDNVSSNTGKADEKASTEASGDPLRIGIRKLLIQGVAFNAETPLEPEPRSGTLPNIKKSNIGGSEGATPAEIGQVIISDLASKIIKQAAEKKVMEAIEEKAGGLLKGLGNALGNKDEDGG